MNEMIIIAEFIVYSLVAVIIIEWIRRKSIESSCDIKEI